MKTRDFGEALSELEMHFSNMGLETEELQDRIEDLEGENDRLKEQLEEKEEAQAD